MKTRRVSIRGILALITKQQSSVVDSDIFERSLAKRMHPVFIGAQTAGPHLHTDMNARQHAAKQDRQKDTLSLSLSLSLSLPLSLAHAHSQTQAHTHTNALTHNTPCTNQKWVLTDRKWCQFLSPRRWRQLLRYCDTRIFLSIFSPSLSFEHARGHTCTGMSPWITWNSPLYLSIFRVHRWQWAQVQLFPLSKRLFFFLHFLF